MMVLLIVPTTFNAKWKMVDGLSLASSIVVLPKVFFFFIFSFLFYLFHILDYDSSRKKDEASYEYYIHY